MINFLIDFILYSDKLADLHTQIIFGMKDSFSSNITPTFLTLGLTIYLNIIYIDYWESIREIEILINSVLFILRRMLFLNNQTLIHLHIERVPY